ncbi:Plasmodium vivax Vir protein, putative [Plasmodium vivax]|uniref:Vir protein, putative n=1 Tax=Plasmodium vivax TaxID=5855 RepID=A0A1G4GSE5_PLAVI|nr:Plasmodium vivax Vir protein, putative [Plasmodium vivax]
MTLLHIFETNINIIKDKLNDQKEEYKIPCRKFVCECLKIYKHMNRTYCHHKGYHREEPTGTCFKLEQFKESYNMYLYNKGDLRAIIPSIDNIDEDLLAKCPEHENRLQLESNAHETQESHSGSSSYTTTEGHSDVLAEDTSITLGNVDNPMKKTITTTVGTVAGASSLLALLYRFTPAKRLVQSGFGGTRGRISNNLYEGGTKELLLNGMEGEDFNSYNHRYDIGYSPV